MTEGARKPGEFCWIDIMTKDLAKTKALFTKLFGWTFSETPIPSGTYTLAECHGTPIGGLTDLTKSPQGKGIPPHVGIHVMVKSADATAKLVTANGGKVTMPPFDVMDAGRMFPFTDPSGAMLNAWEPKKHHGTTIDIMKHGAPGWIDLATNDVDRAGAFYGKVFGWSPESKGHYTEFKVGGKSVAGMMAITKEMGPMPPCWGCYMTVDNIDQTVKACEAAGVKVVVPVQDVPKVGRFAAMRTAEGLMFSAITYTKH